MTDLEEDVRICQPGGKGLFLPLGGEAELYWDTRLKVILYGTGLIYCFLGVSIAADMFMAAIERITSKQHKVPVPGADRYVTVQVWNETVANLTLMALGSSAPEILLSLNDVIKNGFFEGKLGPSTIVGSAAFNLFVIIAVCVNSIPNGEIRCIKELGVFVITAAWSIFAYVWLLYIVHFNTKDVVEVWEGVMTFLFFPLFVANSWAQDAGLLTWANFKGFFCPDMARELTDGDEGDRPPGALQRCCRVVCFLAGRICLRTTRLVSGTYGCFIRLVCPRAMRRRLSAERATADEIAELDDDAVMEVEILDKEGEKVDCEAGVMSFKSDTMKVQAGDEERKYTVTVYRRNGDLGRVTVRYYTVPLSAVPGYDYEEDEDELTFRDSVHEQEIEFTILPKFHGELDDKFQIVIEDESGTVMFNPKRDGGEEKNILTVHISNENPKPRSGWERFLRFADRALNVDEMRLATVQWKEQILESIYCNGSREGQEEAGIQDWLVHIIWVPWKVPLAITTPPPGYLGGWVCFAASLLGIGVLTVIIGDLAELFGCALGVNDSITAISIVALGTSVPDLFASRTAAKQDEYADASIVNVTGSNSVNVFLGIGLPWMFASLYWSIMGASPEWTHRYGESFGAEWGQNGQAIFIVQSGNLFFSVCVFTVCACICLIVIGLRRYLYGGELGGPSDPKAYSSFMLLTLWFIYIALSVWSLSTGVQDISTQMIAISIAIPGLAVSLLFFMLLLQALKVSKKFIGEEGFWGVMVSAGIIGGRILIFFVFQYQ